MASQVRHQAHDGHAACAYFAAAPTVDSRDYEHRLCSRRALNPCPAAEHFTWTHLQQHGATCMPSAHSFARLPLFLDAYLSNG